MPFPRPYSAPATATSASGEGPGRGRRGPREGRRPLGNDLREAPHPRDPSERDEHTRPKRVVVADVVERLLAAGLAPRVDSRFPVNRPRSSSARARSDPDQPRREDRREARSLAMRRRARTSVNASSKRRRPRGVDVGLRREPPRKLEQLRRVLRRASALGETGGVLESGGDRLVRPSDPSAR